MIGHIPLFSVLCVTTGVHALEPHVSKLCFSCLYSIRIWSHGTKLFETTRNWNSSNLEQSSPQFPDKNRIIHTKTSQNKHIFSQTETFLVSKAINCMKHISYFACFLSLISFIIQICWLCFYRSSKCFPKAFTRFQPSNSLIPFVQRCRYASRNFQRFQYCVENTRFSVVATLVVLPNIRRHTSVSCTRSHPLRSSITVYFMGNSTGEICFEFVSEKWT